MKKTVAILGAGPAGLGLAFKLLQNHRPNMQVVIIDKAETEGGTSASFTRQGLHFDYGSHRLHPCTGREILSDIRGVLGDALLKRPRNGRIRISGRFIRFPLNPMDVLLHLPPDFTVGALKDTLLKPFKRKEKKSLSFEDTLLGGLGRTMCSRFYFPYAKKLWGLEPAELSAEQARRRIPSNSPAKMIKKILPVKGHAESSCFYYPGRGFGEISNAYRKEIEKMGGRLMLQSEVVGIKMLENTHYGIKVNQPAGVRHIQSDFVFSTIPLCDLAEMFETMPDRTVRTAAGKLRSRAMVFHYMILATKRFTCYDAHYFPEEEYIFSRVSEPKYYYNGSWPEDLTGICAEIPCNTGDETWNMDIKEMTDRVKGDLKACGLEVSVPVVDSFTKRIPHAYPVYEIGFETYFGIVDEFFSRCPNFVTLGRHGLFVHANIHHALDMGYKAASCLDSDCNWNKKKWYEYRESFKYNVVSD